MARKNKTDLVKQVAEATEVKISDAQIAVEATLDAIKKTLVEGDELALAGFGSFSVTDRAARTARNPRTGETIEVPASKAAKFKPAKALKDALN